MYAVGRNVEGGQLLDLDVDVLLVSRAAGVADSWHRHRPIVVPVEVPSPKRHAEQVYGQRDLWPITGGVPVVDRLTEHPWPLGR